jgi:lipoate---protein ligase
MTFHLIHLQGVSIFEQLQIEEALLRCDTRNWCLLNEAASPAIVMGISGKPHELIEQRLAVQKNVPLIKRFSGGGTVIIDENTLFVTFICQKELHPFPLFPEPMLKWSENFYRSFLPDAFHLKENDYVIENKKCGGNAQYIKKGRWLHHTSFLWDYDEELMRLLLHPKKTPLYRKERSHADFLCRLKDYLPDKAHFFSELKKALKAQYEVIEMNREELLIPSTSVHRKETCYLSLSQ